MSAASRLEGIIDPQEIPADVQKAAMILSNWMKKNGGFYWEYGDICSRHYAHHLKNLYKIRGEKLAQQSMLSLSGK